TFGARPEGICEGVCGTSGNADCHHLAVCPPNGVWRRVGPGPDGMPGNADDPQAAAPLCWTKPCTVDGDCGHGRVCGFDADPLAPHDIVLSCRPNQGTLGGGAPCSTHDSCRSGACVNWSGGARCFGACASDADCNG